MRAVMGLGSGEEFDLIRRFVDGDAADRPDVRVGPGDDCAVIRGAEGDGIAVSTDMSVEGVHFRREWLSPEEIGGRAAAVALSDLAAVAARPIGLLVSLALPDSDVPEPADRIMDGARAAAERHGAALLGGDVTRSPGPLALDCVVLGEAPDPVLRSGARPGDALWVTGELGGAAAAVTGWRRGGEVSSSAREAFARPEPRVEEARWLAARVPLHALIDLSDGLAGDADHIAAASGVRVVLDAERVPVHAAAREAAGNDDGALRLALTGGEDYELCFAAPEDAVERAAAEFEEAFGLALRRVGMVEERSGVWLRHGEGRPERLEAGGFRHFEEEDA